MEEKLYKSTLYDISNKLNEKFDISFNNIDYDNIEIVLDKSNMGGINKNDLTIEFQKQNGSFILIINKEIEENVKNKIIKMISSSINIEPMASYTYILIPNMEIQFWCYEQNKCNFNKGILDELNKLNEIENLIYKKTEIKQEGVKKNF